MLRFLIMFVVIVETALCACAAMFKDGDRVAFLGDSITERGDFNYIRVISDYYLTRFPDSDIRFINAGSNGGGARGGELRFVDDVVSRRANAVSIMFGMNDVGRTSYNKEVTPEKLKARDGHLASFRRNYARLLDVCEKEAPDAALYLLTSSPADDQNVYYRNKACVQRPGSNAGLGECAEIVREEAAKRGATLVDFYTVLNAYIRERRQLEPAFKFADDRVHPGAGANMLMAMTFLAAQNADRIVSDIALREGRSIKSIKADVSDIVTNENGSISFTVLEKSLPMPFADDASSCTNAPIVAEYNQQILAFYMLHDGDWMLTIDGEEICAASAAEWERGVNLAFNKKTPQHRQAMKVLEANRARAARANEIEAARRRIRHEMLHKMPQQKLDPAKAEDREVYLAKSLEKMWWKPAKIQMTAAVREWNDLERLLDECDEAWPKVRALAKPVPHKYVLRRIENVK